jgi:hypothetical protein
MKKMNIFGSPAARRFNQDAAASMNLSASGFCRLLNSLTEFTPYGAQMQTIIAFVIRMFGWDQVAIM